MKVLDLFSGIGGFSLGLERAGMETVAFCEIEDYPRKILKKHWPDVPIYKDVRELDGKKYRNSVDVVCGGFPCQPFSVAGKQRGIEDDRHLWPEMLRIIKEVRPTWVIGENVAGFIRMALDDVLLDLETEGYTTQSFVIPACAVGGVHRRDRVWIVAYRESESGYGCGVDREISEPQAPKSGNSDSEKFSSDSIMRTDCAKQGQKGEKGSVQSERREEGLTGRINRAGPNGEVFQKDSNDANTESKCSNGGESCQHERQAIQSEAGAEGSSNDADTNNERLQGASTPRHTESEGTETVEQPARFRNPKFRPLGLPTESPVRHRDDGFSDNVARLKALGNAVVPQIPELIGRAIIELQNE